MSNATKSALNLYVHVRTKPYSQFKANTPKDGREKFVTKFLQSVTHVKYVKRNKRRTGSV